MYIIATPEEEQRFRNETETVISMKGQTSAAQRTIHYFDMLLNDLTDKSISFEVYSGAYTLDKEKLVITKIKTMDEAVTKAFGGLHEMMATATLERFTRLAKANHCKKLIVFSYENILVEMMFKSGFGLASLSCDKIDVRGELRL